MPIEKIIVLEDDALVRKSLEQQLRNRRFDVAGVGTIAAAQEYLNKDNFDLIFCDVRLPDGDGTEFLKQIQSRPAKPLVIMMTGFGSVESAVTCIPARASRSSSWELTRNVERDPIPDGGFSTIGKPTSSMKAFASASDVRSLCFATGSPAVRRASFIFAL